MNYEFKDIATVDMVETVADTASVLIEEDGIIKRAPKSEVGGGTSTGLSIIYEDYTLKYASDGIYTALLDIFNNCIPVDINIWCRDVDGDTNRMHKQNISNIDYYEDYIQINDNSGYYYIIRSNGDIEINSYD